MEVDRRVWVMLEAEPRDCRGLGYVGVRIAQEAVDDFGPVLSIVRVSDLLDCVFFRLVERLTVLTWLANRPNFFSFDAHFDEIGRFLIIGLAEGNDLAHRRIVPIGEGADNVRHIARFYRLKVGYGLGQQINRILVIPEHFMVLHPRQL